MDKERVKKIVRDNSNFTFDQEEENLLIFSTRENGNMEHEEPGEEDIMEGHRIRRLINSILPEVSITVEECDEWVILTVANKE